MKRCTVCACKVENKNVTGLCQTHWNEKKRREAKDPIGYCKVCSKRIYHTKAHSLCLEHQRRPDRECTACGEILSPLNVSGRCRRHQGLIFSLPEDRRRDYALLGRRGITGARAIAMILSGEVLPFTSRSELRQTIQSREIVGRVSSALGIPEQYILGDVRQARVVEARAVAAKIMQGKGISLSQIGRRLGRDHSSIYHLLRRWPDYVAKSPRLALVVERCAA